MKEYPENGGELKGISTMEDPTKDLSDVEDQSLNDDGLLQDELNIDDEGYMPRSDGIVFETFKRPEVSNRLKDGISNKFVDTIAWPERGTFPENELRYGFFRKSFPRHFPDGKGDITCAGFGKAISFSNWVKHCLKLGDRRFAKDPLFVMTVTNIMQTAGFNPFKYICR